MGLKIMVGRQAGLRKRTRGDEGVTRTLFRRLERLETHLVPSDDEAESAPRLLRGQNPAALETDEC
jgi:hypothetical protein